MGALSTLSPEEWAEIEKAAIAGVSYPELGERFGIDPNTIGQRAWEKEWATPARVRKLREQYQQKPTIPTESVDNLKESKAGALIAQNLAQTGEETAVSVAKSVSALLKQTFDPQKPLLSAPDTWKNAATAFGMVMKATGRDRDQPQVSVNLAMFGHAAQSQGEDWETEGPVVEVSGEGE